MLFVVLATGAVIYETRLVKTLLWTSFFHSCDEDDRNNVLGFFSPP